MTQSLIGCSCAEPGADIHPGTLLNLPPLDLIDDNLRAILRQPLFLTRCSQEGPERALRLMKPAGVMGGFCRNSDRRGAMQFKQYHRIRWTSTCCSVGNVRASSAAS